MVIGQSDTGILKIMIGLHRKFQTFLFPIGSIVPKDHYLIDLQMKEILNERFLELLV